MHSRCRQDIVIAPCSIMSSMGETRMLKPCVTGIIFILCASLPFYLSALLRFKRPSGSLTVPHCDDVDRLRVFVADLPKELNYGLLQEHWSQKAAEANHSFKVPSGNKLLPYPKEPLWEQHSAEYWLLADLLTPPENRGHSIAERVLDPSQADVVFVPFFATLSAKMQLAKSRRKFRHTKDNEDYLRQRRAVDIVKNSSLWQRSDGVDHVFVLTDPVSMYHVKTEIASAVLLVVDFGGWYMEDAKGDEGEDVIRHTQVSLVKDVIVPHRHMLPLLKLSEDRPRDTLLYFRGARHRHRTGLVRDKLWHVLEGGKDVILEEGSPDEKGLEEAMTGMRRSNFCLHPAGDTPSSCRLYDAIASLCIPVIISDNIELPFEGMLDYTEFCLFISVGDALQPGLLLQQLQSVSNQQLKQMRDRLFDVQQTFVYDNGLPGGWGPVVKDGAVDHIWRKIMHKVPAIRVAKTRKYRTPHNSVVRARCHCL